MARILRKSNGVRKPDPEPQRVIPCWWRDCRRLTSNLSRVCKVCLNRGRK